MKCSTVIGKRKTVVEPFCNWAHFLQPCVQFKTFLLYSRFKHRKYLTDEKQQQQQQNTVLSYANKNF